MKCSHSDAEGPAKLEMREEPTILWEFFMTISKSTKNLSTIMRNSCRCAKVSVTIMAKHSLIIALELITS